MCKVGEIGEGGQKIQTFSYKKIKSPGDVMYSMVTIDYNTILYI